VHFADAVIEFRIQGGNPIVSQPHAQDISINEKLPLQTPPPPKKKKKKEREEEISFTKISESKLMEDHNSQAN